MCDEANVADTKELSVNQLREMNLESRHYWH